MGFFSPSKKPNVSLEEFKKVKNSLSSRGLTEREIETVESFFSASMNEEREIDRGIDESEITQGIATMASSENIYHLSKEKLAIVEEELKERL